MYLRSLLFAIVALVSTVLALQKAKILHLVSFPTDISMSDFNKAKAEILSSNEVTLEHEYIDSFRMFAVSAPASYFQINTYENLGATIEADQEVHIAKGSS